MKKVIFTLFCFLITVSLFAEKTNNDLVYITTIPDVTPRDLLDEKMDTGAILFDSEGNLYVHRPLISTLSVYDYKFQKKYDFNVPMTNKAMWSVNFFNDMFMRHDTGYLLLTPNSGYLSRNVPSSLIKSRAKGISVLCEGILIAEKGSKDYVSWLIPSENGKDLIFLDSDSTITHIKTNGKDLSVEDRYIKYKKSVIIGQESFRDYFGLSKTPDLLLAVDRDGNYFMFDVIYDYHGNFLEKLDVRELVDTKTVYGSRTMSPEGDIYFHELNWENNTVDLYRITRDWGYDEREGVVQEDSVRIRVFPDLESRILGNLNKNQKVTVLTETKEKMKIGNMDSVWYKIKTADGEIGWSYGAYIKIK